MARNKAAPVKGKSSAARSVGKWAKPPKKVMKTLIEMWDTLNGAESKAGRQFRKRTAGGPKAQQLSTVPPTDAYTGKKSFKPHAVPPSDLTGS